MSDPDRACAHEHFNAYVDVNRLVKPGTTEVEAYYADIRVTCAGCGEAFRWTGLRAGLSQRGPMCSVDETEMHAPLRPASADPDFGIGLPGFAITYRQGDDRG